MKLFVAACLCLMVLLLFCPRIPRRDIGVLNKYLYAHRGLWDSSLPENSMAAFRKAVDDGFGIELDVQMTKDRHLVIFHDPDLFRMCGVNKVLSDLTLDEVKALRLLDTDEEIPSFEDVLRMVDGRVPLIVEMKTGFDIRHLCEATARLLDQYSGPFCIESFHPVTVLWFRLHRPQWIRGQLAFGLTGDKYRITFQNIFVSSMLQNLLSRPDFIAFDVDTNNSMLFQFVSHLFHPWKAGWTFTDQVSMDRLRDQYDLLMFEGFLPDSGGQ